MKAIVDILKERNLYTFMAVKEHLLTEIETCLQNTEYANKYGLSGSFTSTDQTVSVVVGILSERAARNFISSGSSQYTSEDTPLLREYVYGLNVTGINDDEVKSISKYLYYYIIERIPEINFDVRARLYPDIYLQQVTPTNVGDKRMWSANMFITAAILEIYQPPEQGDGHVYGSDGLYADGHVPPDYSSCVIIEGARQEPVTTEPITTEPITTEPITTEPITTEPPIPVAPIIMYWPATEATITLYWNAVEYADGYILDVAEDPEYQIMVDGYNEKVIYGTSAVIILGEFDFHKPYYCRLKAFNAYGRSPYSPTVTPWTRYTFTLLAGEDPGSMLRTLITLRDGAESVYLYINGGMFGDDTDIIKLVEGANEIYIRVDEGEAYLAYQIPEDIISMEFANEGQQQPKIKYIDRAPSLDSLICSGMVGFGSVKYLPTTITYLDMDGYTSLPEGIDAMFINQLRYIRFNTSEGGIAFIKEYFISLAGQAWVSDGSATLIIEGNPSNAPDMSDPAVLEAYNVLIDKNVSMKLESAIPFMGDYTLGREYKFPDPDIISIVEVHEPRGAFRYSGIQAECTRDAGTEIEEGEEIVSYVTIYVIAYGEGRASVRKEI